ncbi:MAG: winged helix-turn-helix domain-containing protein [Acidobacteriota bacterium]
MTAHGPTWRVARFGAFEVHRESGELRKRGLRIKVQEQPFRILVVLLERRGEIVTREELQQTLWPEGTFVDFEHSLNAAIGKLRQALSDSAGTPRFVETVARRGYRFSGPVEFMDQPLVAPIEPTLVEPAAARSSATQRWVVGAVAVAGLAALTGAWIGKRAEPSPEQAAVPLTSYLGYEWHPAFSPDGSQVAFTWNGPAEDNTDIYVKAVGSGEPLRLTTDPGVDDVPAWSPDGNWIAFVRRHPTAPQGDVYVIPALGGVERKVGKTTFTDLLTGPTLAWTRDGKWLAVRNDRDSMKTSGLHLISVDTGESKLMLGSAAAKRLDYGATFSLDGTKLAFCRDGNVYVADLDGLATKGEPRQLTRDPSAVARSPAWTPNQQDIVFQRWMGLGSSTLWRVRADGREEAKPISNSGLSAYHPVVSAGGRRLAYADRVYDSNIWRLPLQTAGVSAGPPVRLIASTRVKGTMAISPDGRKVAFGSTRSGGEQIWMSESDGSRQVQLTKYPGGLVGTPRWSPDGQFLAYDARVNGNRDIYMMPAAGGAARRLTVNAEDDRIPAWSADGKWIYFSTDKGGPREIWKKPAGGGVESQVTRGGGYAARETPDGMLLCYFAASSEGLWVVPLQAGVPDERRKRLVAQHASSLVFDVSNSGVYFGDQTYFGELNDRNRPRTDTVYFYDFATNRTSVVAKMGKELSIGISVSPDEKWLLFSQVDRASSDLVIVDGFQ